MAEVRANGTGSTYQGGEFSPGFSPDGSQVAFTWCKDHKQAFSTGCGVYIKQIGEEKPFPLADGPQQEISPVWSPDGRHIAFARVFGSQFEVVLVPQRGGHERVVADFPFENRAGTMFERWRHIAWMPDSRRLVVRGWESLEEQSRLYVVDTATGERSPITDRGWDPAVSHDGRWLAFNNGENVVLELSAEGKPQGEAIPLARGFFWGGAWTNDGREIIGAGPWQGLWRIPRTGSPLPTQLLYERWASCPAISPQGGRLAYSLNTADSNIWRLKLPDAGGKTHAPEPLIGATSWEMNPDYSGDGSRIVFVSDRSGKAELWTCHSDGTSQAQLTRLGSVSDPRWSPTGEHIAFRRGDDIYVINARGGEALQLTDGPGRKWVNNWSADGQWLYFAAGRGDGNRIWRVSPNGGDAQPAFNNLLEPRSSGWPASPDGEHIVFQKGNTLYRVRSASPAQDPVPSVTGIAEDNIVEIFDDGVYYMGQRDEDDTHGIFFKDFATGEVTTLGRTSGPAGFWSFSVAPDRSAVLYLQYDHVGTDLMLVEDFR